MSSLHEKLPGRRSSLVLFWQTSCGPSFQPAPYQRRLRLLKPTEFFLPLCKFLVGYTELFLELLQLIYFVEDGISEKGDLSGTEAEGSSFRHYSITQGGEDAAGLGRCPVWVSLVFHSVSFKMCTRWPEVTGTTIFVWLLEESWTTGDWLEAPEKRQASEATGFRTSAQCRRRSEFSLPDLGKTSVPEETAYRSSAP